MNRRSFLTFGGALSVSSVSVGAIDSQGRAEDLPRFESGRVLTHEQLNDLVDRINELSRASRQSPLI